MITRRRFLTDSSALALTSLGIADALAQGGGLAQSGLVGTLEGSQVVTDAAAIPKTFNEAPDLAELVKQGKLPPVAQRIPDEPLVLKPLEAVGKYGGTWRRGFLGPGDWENGNRLNASDKLLFWDYTGTKIVPSAPRSWEQSADGKIIRSTLRKGMKWSDGAPFTADDFVFWFEDLYSNKDLVPAPIADMSAGGKPGRVVKIDETTVEFQFDNPHYLFVDLLAGDTLIGGGQSVRQSQGFTYGAYAPKHYLKQFLPKYSSEQAVNEKAKAEGYENWVKLLHFKKDWSLNPELPTIGPWKTVRPINTPTWVLERNPYYWAVDTAGNQLPYIDRVVLTLAEDPEVINLRAIGGNYDMQERHINLSKLPVILENRKKGGYTVHLDTALHGSDTTLQVNQTFTADPEIAKWLTNADFRRALSLGIDRNQLNETFWLGVGTPGSAAPSVTLPQSPGKEWRTKWSTYDPAKANQMLDALGLTKKDSEGFRVRTDNGERLRIQVQAVKALLPWPQQAEMIAQQWRKIGIQADVREMERTLAFTRTRNNEHQIHDLDQRRHGAPLPVPAPRHPGRYDRSFHGPRIRQLVCVERSAGPRADRSEHEEDPRAVPFRRRPEGAGGARQDGAGDLEAPGRPAIRHRHGRRVAGAVRRAARQQQARQHSRRASASPSIAARRAARIPRPGTSSNKAMRRNAPGACHGPRFCMNSA